MSTEEKTFAEDTTVYDGVEDCVLAGAMLYDDTPVALYVRPSTGDVCYVDPMSEEGMLVSELSVKDPIEIPSVSKALEALKSEFDEKYAGRIYTEQHEILILADRSAVLFREYGEVIAPNKLEHKVDFDIVDPLMQSAE